jgi:predicted enzyme related to lactoylglutathione lyase
MANALNWFEIPTTDLDRAMKFYGAILDITLESFSYGSGDMAVLPYEEGKEVGGALVKDEGYVPSNTGSVVYLNGGEDLQVVLDRVSEAGGTPLSGKIDLGDNGFAAYFLDTEGNRVGLHSMN